MGGRDVAVVIVDIVSIVDWLNPWRRLEGGPVLALGQSWMVMCAILSVSGAMCLADILILTLPNTLAHVMENVVAAIFHTLD